MSASKLPPSIPTHIPTLTTKPYKVSLEKDLIQSKNAFGMTNSLTRQVTLDKSLLESESILWATFWHEVFHVFLFESGLDNLLKGPVKESLCDAFGTYMTKAMEEGFIKLDRVK